MYGLVNKEIDHGVFARMETYPDDITCRLVRAASEVLEVSPEQVLEARSDHAELTIEVVTRP